MVPHRCEPNRVKPRTFLGHRAYDTKLLNDDRFEWSLSVQTRDRIPRRHGYRSGKRVPPPFRRLSGLDGRHDFPNRSLIMATHSSFLALNPLQSRPHGDNNNQGEKQFPSNLSIYCRNSWDYHGLALRPRSIDRPRAHFRKGNLPWQKASLRLLAEWAV